MGRIATRVSERLTLADDAVTDIARSAEFFEGNVDLRGVVSGHVRTGARMLCERPQHRDQDGIRHLRVEFSEPGGPNRAMRATSRPILIAHSAAHC